MTSSRAIVVTGAGGMIGANLVQALNAAGHDVIACDYSDTLDRVRHLADFGHDQWLLPSELPQWIDQNSSCVRAIFHLGAISDTTVKNITLLREVNVEFSLELWRLACKANLPFYYASSAATYGNGDWGFTDIDDLVELERLKPLNPYAWSKQTVDQAIIHDWRKGKDTPECWGGFKFFNVYGPHEEHKAHMRSVVRKILPQIVAGEAVQLFKSHKWQCPDGGQARDFIYVVDAVEMLLNALAAPSLSGLFNVGTGKARSFLDLANATFVAAGKSPQIEFIDMPEQLRAQYQYFTQADISKATEFGLQPECLSLEQGIFDYVQKLLRDPERIVLEIV